MTTFNTYQEAKIANPESDIYKDGERFCDLRSAKYYFDMKKCNPADYCMTVERFLADGHRLSLRDIVMDESGNVIVLEFNGHTWNDPCAQDGSRYVLRAKALEQPKHTKVEYENVTDSIFDLKEDFENRKLFNKKSTGTYGQIVHVKELAGHLDNGNVYRKVTTELTEREAFIEHAKGIVDLMKDVRHDSEYVAELLFEAGCRLVNGSK